MSRVFFEHLRFTAIFSLSTVAIYSKLSVTYHFVSRKFKTMQLSISRIQSHDLPLLMPFSAVWEINIFTACAIAINENARSKQILNKLIADHTHVQ